jgi:hypothetical protein
MDNAAGHDFFTANKPHQLEALLEIDPQQISSGRLI